MIEKFLEVKVLSSSTDERIELTPPNTWCDPVPLSALEDLKVTLHDLKIPHILARVDYETVDSYKVGYVAFIANRYNRKFLPTGNSNTSLHMSVKTEIEL